MAKIEYITAGIESLDIIEPLWLDLNEHHRIYSNHFSSDFQRTTFKQRKQQLLEKSTDGDLRIHLAKDTDTGVLVGYCVSTISKEQLGEIESIFVEEYFRSSGIGDNLMKYAMAWMREKSVNRIILGVSVGNEEAIKFYGRYGFFPRTTIMERTYPSGSSDV